MALTDTTRDYEVLIRFREDGTVAAHKQQIREIKEDGVLISATPGPATEITVAELQALVAGF